MANPLRTAAGLLAVSAFVSSASAADCATSFSAISAKAWVAAINPGWNLGNTLDAIPTEGSWNNAPVDASTFSDIKEAGFNSVRVPVTYREHFVSGAPDYTVNATWLQRLSDVVDLATAEGLYVLTNVHHDSTDWLDVTKSGANITAIEDKFYRLWYQIGQTLKCKSSLLGLEPVNEPPANTAADAAVINKLNEIFLKALADSGGYNSQRVVTLVGPTSDATKTSQWFVPPKSIANPWALQFHYYSPYDFLFGAWGKTIWGSDADKAAVASDLGIVRGNFSDVPLVIGEFSASPIFTEAAARWRWTDHLVRTAQSLGIAVILWDNGLDNLDRAAHSWRDVISVEIIVNAAQGINNSLPDSTTDPLAPMQNSSAYIFQNEREGFEEIHLPWLYNGNELQDIRLGNGFMITGGREYNAEDTELYVRRSFISQYFPSSSGPDERSNLTIVFSDGARSRIELVPWDTPTLPAGSSGTFKVSKGQSIKQPINWHGLHRVAAVKVVKLGTEEYIFDTWTQYLGPLQRGRATYGNHYDWDEETIQITEAAVNAVVDAKVTATFTFEFWPRVPGNNLTLTVVPSS